MDNCTIHHTAAIKELLLDAGILVFFLPPYSPDLNPIEEAFSSVKYYLKQHDELLQSITNPFPVIYSAFNSILLLKNAMVGLLTLATRLYCACTHHYL